jgi:putative transposase
VVAGGAADGVEFKALQRGWCHGSEEFRQELLAQMGERAGAEHYGEEIQETAEAKAERVVSEELKKADWSQEQLKQRRKGDPRKLRMALRLRRETTMTLAWIAQRLHMGTKTHLSHLLYWQKREGDQKNVAT